ncbi:LysR family transcriptional regulator [Pelomonas sp. HMWF004]|nr:LysR family transcriptional regulator [Pelomonas sp. HMWF004]
MTRYTLDQFVVFASVVDCGGFAAAARKLGRAQSAVTHAVRNLEESSGLLLFDRSGYRAALTDAGRALLPRARQVLAEADGFRRASEGFALGLEASLVVAVGPFVHEQPLAEALSRLHAQHPSVRVVLRTEAHGHVLELLGSGQAQLGLLAEATPIGPQFESFRCAEQTLVAVAAPSHPLAAEPQPIAPERLRQHMQVVWHSGTESLTPQDLGVHATDCWYVNALASKRSLLLAGVGWGSLPDHLVTDDIAAGRLVRLEPLSWEGRDRMPSFHTITVWRRDAVAGPAQRALLTLLRDPLRAPA